MDRGRFACAASAHSPAARPLCAGADEFRGRRVRRPCEPRGAACGRREGGAAGRAGCGADRRRGARRAPRAPSSRRSTARRSDRCRRRTRRSPRRRSPRPRRGSPPGRRGRSRSAPRRSNGPPISTSRTATRLLALLQHEGGKTLDDALAEVREAVDFCRYYAAEARRTLGAGAHAGPDRRDQRAAPSRPRRVRLHQPVEFSARDLHRPDRRRAGRRQCRRRQARRADAADRERRRAADA